LAVINQGLPEYEADNARRHGNAGVTIGVTLLRCVGYLSRGDLSTRNQYAGPSTATPDAQCLGEHTYRLALYPFVGEHDDAQLHQPAHEHNVPVLAAETTRHSGTLPATASLVEIDAPHLVLSTLKGAEDREALILRLYNPTMQEQQGRIRLLRLPRTVVEVNLNEQPIGPATVDTAGYISLTMRPKGVRTLMLSWSSV
ncbi:MAG: hypothetical protein HY335_06535, partial [Deinococcus sp.]|nr:hypothetical protein [Deinococcus sp.]